MVSLIGVSMRLNIKNNIKDVTRDLTKTQKKQIPFATAIAINKTLGIGKNNRMKGLDREMKKQMVKKLDRPMPRTTKAFYRIPATKTSLTGVLGFTDWASNFMIYQIDGGVRTSNKLIPVPAKNAKLNKYGNIIGKRTGLIKKKTQFFGEVRGTTGLWERTNKGHKVKLIIGLHNDVSYRAKFPFYVIADKYSTNTFDKNFKKAIDKALRTAK